MPEMVSISAQKLRDLLYLTSKVAGGTATDRDEERFTALHDELWSKYVGVKFLSEEKVTNARL